MTVERRDGRDPAEFANHFYADGAGDPETCTDEGHNHPADMVEPDAYRG